MKKMCYTFMCAIISVGLFSGCTQEVNEKEITITVEGQVLTGSYTGTMRNKVPDGKGRFVSKTEERLLEYDGEWEQGNIIGNGNLKDTKYMVPFLEVNRIGEYSGEVVNGKAHGNGSFTAINDKDEKYTYTGEWQNGLCNGQGVREYENKDYSVLTGTFKNGEFAPTKLEFIKSMGDRDAMRFAPTDKAEEFIKAHEDLFPATDSVDLTEWIDSSIVYKNLIKSPDKYGDKLINLPNYEITQIWENELYGYTCTEFLARAANYDDYVYGCYLGELSNVYEGSKINIQGLPVNNSSFKNIGGGTTLCYIIYASKIY